MIYTELLRVRNALRVTAIVLGVLLLLVVLGHLWIASRGGDAMVFVHDIQDAPGTVTSSTVLPDGTKRTTYDNAVKQVRMIVDDRGYAGTHIEIFERSEGSHEKNDFVSVGSVQVQALANGRGREISIDTNEPEPFAFYATIAAAVALVIATVLGAPLARENDGHLEIALTKPFARELSALAVIGTDLAGIVGAWLLTVIFLIVAHTLFAAPHLTFGWRDGLATILGFAGAFSWYAMLCAATASMSRAYGVVLGLSWPVSLVVFALARIDPSNNPVLQAIHGLAYVVAFALPLNYMHFGAAYFQNGKPAGALLFQAQTELPALLALFAIYVAAAVVQWRRVEA